MSFDNHGFVCPVCFRKVDEKRYSTRINELLIKIFDEKYDECIEYQNEILSCIILLNKYINKNLEMENYSIKKLTK
jgi:hypothetical protein